VIRHASSTTCAYTRSLHDALPILAREAGIEMAGHRPKGELQFQSLRIRLIGIYGSEDAPIGAERSFNLTDNEHECILMPVTWDRSEEHTSELQSRFDLVCRLLLEK